MVEERFYVSENRPQGVLDIVDRDYVAVDLLAGDPRNGTFVLDEKSRSRMERRARSAEADDLRKCAGTFSTRLTDAGQCRTRAATLPPNGEWASTS